MHRPRPRICIVTPTYISSTPRVIREADVLSAAGMDVSVVFSQGQLENVRAIDAEELSRDHRWVAMSVKWSKYRSDERWAYYGTGLRHRLAQKLPRSSWSYAGVVERAEGRVYPELARAVSSVAADLYIAHYPIGLAAAAQAARAHGGRLGYDIEDLYADVYPDGPAWALPRERIITIERRYVPSCVHISAVSAPVAEAFATRYERPVSVIVHNCDRWSDRQSMDGRMVDRRGPQLSLYWYSQTVGFDRGLEDAIRAAALLPGDVQLHLRGSVTDGVRSALQTLAEAGPRKVRLEFHPLVPPAQLLSRAAEHDVGLALESTHALNRDITVTNKLFLYLAAGLGIAATRTVGQQSVMATCPESGFLYAPGDVRTLADGLAIWQDRPEALSRAKAAALDAARTRWNLEREGERLVESVNRALHAAATTR